MIQPPERKKDFFNIINLNDTVAFDVRLTVNPPNMQLLKDKRIDRFVVTNLSFDGDTLVEEKTDGARGAETNTIEYVATTATGSNQPAQSKLIGTFDINKQTQGVVKYAYLVAYNDGTKSYQSPVKTSPPQNYYLDLSDADVGVLSLTLDGSLLPWGVLSSASIDLKYPAAGGWDTSVTLTPNEKTKLIVKPFGKPIDLKLGYRVTALLTAGDPSEGPWIEIDPLASNVVKIASPLPFGQSKAQINFALDAGLKKGQIRASYKLSKDGRSYEWPTMVSLEEGKVAPAWEVPLSVSGDKGKLHFVRARVTDASGGTKDLPLPSDESVTTDISVTLQKDSIDIF